MFFCYVVCFISLYNGFTDSYMMIDAPAEFSVILIIFSLVPYLENSICVIGTWKASLI